MGTAPVAGSFDWDELYRRHAPDLRRLIARRIPSDAAVEDVLQETFVRAFRSRDRFDPTRPAWPWLATLAHRSCIKWWRTQRALLDEPLVDDATVNRVAPIVSPGSDEHLRRFEQRRATTEALSSLAPRHRRVLYRHAAEDVPYERIAQDEAISPQALKSLLNRARVHFREHYLRLLEESAGILVLGKTALARLRARLSEREVVLWERLAPVAGTVLVAGVVSALTVPTGTAPARADTVHIAAVRSIDTTTTSAVPTSTRTTAEGHAAVPVEGSGPESRSPSRGAPPDVGGAGRLPVTAAAGGGITSGTEESTAEFWVDVDEPLVGTITFGTEVRCDAGPLATLECTVLRTLPLPN